MFLLVLTGHNITGLQLQEECDKIGITLNKNAIPNDPLGPRLASGVRIGTPAMTTKGWDQDDFRACARMIDALIKRLEGEV
jgi:glycine hydroxymethyltransferase